MWSFETPYVVFRNTTCGDLKHRGGSGSSKLGRLEQTSPDWMLHSNNNGDIYKCTSDTVRGKMLTSSNLLLDIENDVSIKNYPEPYPCRKQKVCSDNQKTIDEIKKKYRIQDKAKETVVADSQEEDMASNLKNNSAKVEQVCTLKLKYARLLKENDALNTVISNMNDLVSKKFNVDERQIKIHIKVKLNNVDKCHNIRRHVRTAFDRKEKGESAELMEEVMKCLESLESLWGDFESGLGVTARLWSMYIDMMLILRRYIHAERAGLWQQHLQEVRNMLPYTIASGHSKYMSCLPIYLNEMQKLPETAPEVHEEFAAGKFTVHQTAGDFNGVWTDLAMAFIQRFNTLGSSTFGQLQERYRDKLLNMKPRHCTEVHFVGDQYDFELKSLKCDERQRQESNINLPEYVPANSMKIPDWKTLLSNPCNRTNMLSYLASRWSQEAFWPAGFCLVLGVNAQATRVTQTEHTDVDELYSPNHEEADTRIFAHIASCDDNNVFVIQATDTDIIFLAMYHFPRLPNVVELWVEKNDLFLSIHDLVNELAKAVGKDGLALTDTLLISYILSGCDSVSYPFKRGKKRTVKVALEHVDKHPTLSNCIRHESGPSAHDQVITEARSFFCDLYGKPGYLSLDKLRAHLFASSKLDLRSLPPTEDAFIFHICLYKQASLSNPVLLPPEEYGRIVDGDRLIPVMKSKPSKPSAAKLKYCKCKKKPNCLRNCPCAKAAVPCIIACACNGDREKCERLLADHYDDDDDEEEEIVLMTLLYRTIKYEIYVVKFLILVIFLKFM
ncbi:hypothetical protein GQR58_030167 [Nymphon striatum]|nr:hypothetical protein GQR58_030167 [Nymphon striatum]